MNMNRNSRIAGRISFICLILGFGSVNGTMGVRVAQEYDFLPMQVEKRLPMLDSYFPYDSKRTPFYEFTWVMQYIASILASLVYSGVYCVFVGLMLHLCSQVSNIKLNLKKLNKRSADPHDNHFRTQLGIIVERHEKLNRFAAEIETIFNIMFLAEILSCTIQICLQFFMMMTFLSSANKRVSIFLVMFMMVYIMHIGTHVFICCYVAEKLREESSSIFQSAYKIEWYNLSTKDAKMLLIIMLKTRQPLTVTAGKFCQFSIRLYAQILKTSGGYLSMLLAVKSRLANQ